MVYTRNEILRAHVQCYCYVVRSKIKSNVYNQVLHLKMCDAYI
jgi:hypothetical protein